MLFHPPLDCQQGSPHLNQHLAPPLLFLFLLLIFFFSFTYRPLVRIVFTLPFFTFKRPCRSKMTSVPCYTLSFNFVNLHLRFPFPRPNDPKPALRPLLNAQITSWHRLHRRTGREPNEIQQPRTRGGRAGGCACRSEGPW